MISQITPLILTYNEAANIHRTLEMLDWATEIFVVDSFSTDETIEIISAFPQVRVVRRQFDSFAEQCNFGLEQIQTEWVLSLDADYVLSEELVREFHQLKFESGTAGYFARFQYWMCGHPLHASLYPPRAVLYRKGRARYYNDGHGHRVHIEGPTESLKGPIYHDDRKSLSRWLWAQDKYAALEAQKLLSAPLSSLSTQDRLRLWMLPAPFVVPLYTLFWKRLICDGWPGWLYVFQRTTAELVLSMHLLERKLSSPSRTQNSALPQQKP
jgi:glycosyltransferase involved in cell wall biosynthesis